MGKRDCPYMLAHVHVSYRFLSAFSTALDFAFRIGPRRLCPTYLPSFATCRERVAPPSARRSSSLPTGTISTQEHTQPLAADSPAHTFIVPQRRVWPIRLRSEAVIAAPPSYHSTHGDAAPTMACAPRLRHLRFCAAASTEAVSAPERAPWSGLVCRSCRPGRPQDAERQRRH